MTGRTPPGADPPPQAPPADAPAPRFGAPRADAVPRMEFVRVTAPDLARRAAMERTRGRIVMAATGFLVLFSAVALKLADATIVQPVRPRAETVERRPEPVDPRGVATAAASVPSMPADFGVHARRAMIVDRNGEILAVSLPTASVYANPRELIDPAEAAHRLHGAIPSIDEAQAAARLAETTKQFVYLARNITPREQLAVNSLGIPGIYFEATERRRYPLGRVAAHILGGVDVDGHGVAGVEKFFDQRLHEESDPLRLSLDVRVQGVLREELARAMGEFNAIGACGIVMDVRTGEVLGMVSLPDYDANAFGSAPPDDRRNRAVLGVYEPGSTFKLQTAAMALDYGVVNIWNGFDATSPIHIGRFTINDFEGKHRWLYLPEILAFSSNIGAARMAEAVGAERQRAWLGRMGMLTRTGIELPEVGMPLAPPPSNWKEIATLTIGFGHGIAVSPLHVVAGTAALANGGTLFRPTILAPEPGAPARQGTRVMQPGTSDIIRKLMRLVVTDGYGKAAEVPGYFVGGKTGTAEKISGRGYNHNSRVSAFMSAFPMNSPHYAVYFMLDEPKANASTHGYATAGWVSAPSAGRVIARIGPMLGLLPDTANAAEIQASLYIPLQPGHGSSPRPPLPAVPAPAAPKPAPPVAATPPRQVPVHSPTIVPPPLPQRQAGSPLREAALESADGSDDADR